MPKTLHFKDRKIFVALWISGAKFLGSEQSSGSRVVEFEFERTKESEEMFRKVLAKEPIPCDLQAVFEALEQFNTIVNNTQ